MCVCALSGLFFFGSHEHGSKRRQPSGQVSTDVHTAESWYMKCYPSKQRDYKNDSISWNQNWRVPILWWHQSSSSPNECDLLLSSTHEFLNREQKRLPRLMVTCSSA